MEEEDYSPSFMEEVPRNKPLSDDEFDDVLGWLGLNSYSELGLTPIGEANAKVQATMSYNMNKPLTGSFSDQSWNEKFNSPTFNRTIGTITKYNDGTIGRPLQ